MLTVRKMKIIKDQEDDGKIMKMINMKINKECKIMKMIKMVGILGSSFTP